MKTKFAGLTATDMYLNVHAEVGDGPVQKYAVIKVPLEALLHPEVTDALDRCVRRELAQAWSRHDGQDNLF